MVGSIRQARDKKTKDNDDPVIVGEGTYGRVIKSIYNGVPSAVKINMFYERSGWCGIVNLIEYSIMKMFQNHPLVLKLYDVKTKEDPFITKIESESVHNTENIFDRDGQLLDNIHFIMELGDSSLYSLLQVKTLDIYDTAKIMADILLFMECMHKNNVLHRDMKTDNVIIMKNKITKEYTAKVCDFGMSCHYVPQDKNCGQIATYATRSPELVMGEKYGEANDIWAVGCILYEILFNKLPIELGTRYNSKRQKVYEFDKRIALLSIVKNCNNNLSKKEINNLLNILQLQQIEDNIERTTIKSRIAKLPNNAFGDSFSRKNLTALLNGLLNFNQKDRPTVSQALDMPFFDNLRDYINEIRAHNVKYDMTGCDLKMVECSSRNMAYDKILKKKSNKSLHSKRERIYIHTLITFERWLRARSKGGRDVNFDDQTFVDNYIICEGLMEKLLGDGTDASSFYINRVDDIYRRNAMIEDAATIKDVAKGTKGTDVAIVTEDVVEDTDVVSKGEHEEQQKEQQQEADQEPVHQDWFARMEEDIILNILQHPYETTPYEIANERGFLVKDENFKSIVREMKRCIRDDEVMNMEAVVDKALGSVTEDKGKKEDEEVDQNKRTEKPKRTSTKRTSPAGKGKVIVRSRKGNKRKLPRK